MARSVPYAPSTTSPATGGIVGRTWRWRVRNKHAASTGSLRCSGAWPGMARGRLGGYEKRAEATDRSVAQVNEKVREVGTKLSAQLDQQAAVMARLEEAIKQVDIQTGPLSAEVKRFQGVLSEFDKVLHSLNDKTTDVDRRVTELTNRTRGRGGGLATQQGDQAVKLDALGQPLRAG